MEKEKVSIDMSQPVKLIHLVITVIGLLITGASMIYSKGTESANTANRVEFLEKQFAEYKEESKKQDERTTQQIQKVDDKVNQILIILQNKQDRK